MVQNLLWLKLIIMESQSSFNKKVTMESNIHISGWCSPNGHLLSYHVWIPAWDQFTFKRSLVWKKCGIISLFGLFLLLYKPKFSVRYLFLYVEPNSWAALGPDTSVSNPSYCFVPSPLLLQTLVYILPLQGHVTVQVNGHGFCRRGASLGVD